MGFFGNLLGPFVHASGLDRPRDPDDLPENAFDLLPGERAAIFLFQTAQNRLFSGLILDLDPVLSLEGSDPLDNCHPLIEKPQHLEIQLVDLSPQVIQIELAAITIMYQYQGNHSLSRGPRGRE